MTPIMETLHWELSVLTKAVQHRNLSAASAHIGLSQPQLSRIVSKLEAEFGIVLLDRAARRKSGWTPMAAKVADAYLRNSRKLNQALLQITSDAPVTQVAIGVLEGMIPFAVDASLQLRQSERLETLELNVYDLAELEERFEREELDVILTSREPGRHHYRHVHPIGWQTIRMLAGDRSQSGPAVPIRVLSPFERLQTAAAAFHRQGRPAKLKTPQFEQTLISNSLSVRRDWLSRLPAQGQIPSEVRSEKPTGADPVPVLLVGQDLISSKLWSQCQKAFDCGSQSRPGSGLTGRRDRPSDGSVRTDQRS